MSSSPQPRTNLLVPILLVTVLAVLLVDTFWRPPELQPVLASFYQWLMLLGGVTLLLGVINVAVLHARRIQAGARDWMLSLILLAVLLAVFVAGLVNQNGATSPIVTWVFDHVVAPGQAALFALLVFFMAAAAFRFLRIGRPGGAWMLAGALLVLLVQWPMAGVWLPLPVVDGTFWLVNQPVMAAVRGVLLGSGIAMLIAGLRLLLGKA
jgi:hypothetical protein